MKRTGSAASWGAVRSPLVSAATGPKCMRTQGGLSDWLHSRHKWKPEQNIIAMVVIVGIAVNALLCDRRGFLTVLYKAGFTSYTFLD